jgi:RNA polymerase sigma-70 factor (ECF subfamily)
VDEGEIRAQVGRARAGGTEAFAELFRAFAPDVERLCRRLLGGSDESDDAASETFLRARRALGSYDATRPFRGWLLAIAAHHCLDRLRRRSTEQRLFVADAPDPEELRSRAPSPLDGTLQAEARGRLLRAIEGLPERYRVPVVLRYYADLDYEAISGLLGVSHGQVATLLFRARRRLRHALASAQGPGAGA